MNWLGFLRKFLPQFPAWGRRSEVDIWQADVTRDRSIVNVKDDGSGKWSGHQSLLHKRHLTLYEVATMYLYRSS